MHLIEQRVELLPHDTQKMERLFQLLSGEERGKRGLALVFANTIPMAKKARTLGSISFSLSYKNICV